MNTLVLPQNYEEWRRCITVDCGIELTPDYISQRLSALNNKKDHHTQKFIKLYGEAHLQSVIGWFLQSQAAAE